MIRLLKILNYLMALTSVASQRNFQINKSLNSWCKKIIKRKKPIIIFESIEFDQRKLISDFLVMLNYVIYDQSYLKLFTSKSQYCMSKSINFLTVKKNHYINDIIK